MTTRLVFPEIPAPSEWLPYLQPALDANWHTNFGPVCRQFEQRLKTLYGRSGEGVVAVSNATSGLSACLIAARISGPVLCPAFTFQATAAAILGASCTPVIVDCEKEQGIIPPELLEAGLKSSGARAAIVVAPYGIATDFREHAEICASHGALLIIDNAAGLGIDRSSPQTSAAGDNVREVFSLHATKPFGIGEGGAIFAPEDACKPIEAAVNFGLATHTATGTNKGPYWGINGKMPEMAAAVGLAVADKMATRVAARQDMASNWFAALEPFSIGLFTKSPLSSPWQCFPIIMPDEDKRDRFMALAADNDFEFRKYYHPSLGDCTGMQHSGPCPNASMLSARSVVLPMRSFMPKPEQDRIIDKVIHCLSDSLS